MCRSPCTPVSIGWSYQYRAQAWVVFRWLIAAIAWVVPAPVAAVPRRSSSVRGSTTPTVATFVARTAISQESAKNSPRHLARSQADSRCE